MHVYICVKLCGLRKKIWKYTSEVVLKVYMSLIKGKGKAKRRQAKGEKNLYSLKYIIT